MEMDGRAGHLVWRVVGAGFGLIGQLPAEYRQRAEQKYPEPMSADLAAG